MTWMLYGANGYTGQLIADLAVRRGHRPILAGRTEAKIAPLAEDLGLEYRAFDLTDAEKPLSDVEAVAHCAGPFSATSAPMVAACLKTGTHYIDITGEIDVFEAIAKQDDAAKQANVVLLPGAGFDVVPTDCVAAMLKEALPDATHLDLAFLVGGGASAGTAKTTVESASAGGRVRENGVLKTERIGQRTRIADFPAGPRRVGSMPWGDVSTAYRSTGIPNITTFTAFPGAVGQLQAIFAPILGTPLFQKFGKSVVERFIGGPDEHKRKNTICQVFGEAWNAEKRVSIALKGPNAYSLTADSVVKAIEKIGDVPPGSHTPSSAFGADYVRELDGVEVSPVKAGK
ncbi:membrane protein [Lentzea sp. NBRC 105346]|uniref:saccharopine dehydrogenase family protein n=1 Tax=Lentzea sp. NBRC 105346 TaxID=3032205 RepID=UPI0024A319CF|nr:saccharopine dehydrogenase NADP-binding domain-containing protein [Lentzea sp. NBRC 105346]GLZ36154.1 membrane protein [Lentzea sp. NBRC 105346]